MRVAVSVEPIVAVLGGPKIVGKGVKLDGPLAFIDLVRKGLPYSALKAAGARLALGERETGESLGIAARTLDRRKDKRLRVDETERLLNFARVVAYAQEVFEEPATMKRWFLKVSRALGARPLDLVKSPFGVEALLAELTRIEHGVHG